MRSYITNKTNRILTGLLLSCLLAASVLAAGVSGVFAATYGEEVEITVPYTHIYDAEANRDGDVFRYRIVPQKDSPLPEGSHDGAYFFDVEAAGGGKPVSGEIVLKTVFSEPGEYSYKVMAVPGNAEGVTYESRTYTLNVYVRTNKNDGGITLMVTAVGEDGRKYERLQLNPAHENAGVPQRPITTPEGDGGTVIVPTVPAGDDEAADDNAARGGTGNQDQAAAENGAEPEDAGPLSELIDSVVPKAAPDRNYCSLINIMLTILCAAAAIALVLRYFERVDDEEDEYIIRRQGKWRLASVIPAALSIIVLFCVEDLKLPKRWITDEWTAFFAGMLIISLAIIAIVWMKYDREEQKYTNKAA